MAEGMLDTAKKGRDYLVQRRWVTVIIGSSFFDDESERQCPNTTLGFVRFEFSVHFLSAL